MGTATLTRAVFQAGNGGHSLHIDSGKDHITFGDKAGINGREDGTGKFQQRTRGTIECDLRIGRSTINGYREIGVDFKHVRGAHTRSTKADDHNQIVNVAKVIEDGTIHEYHYVTNGKFSDTFKGLIAEANASLVGEGRTPPISYHEYVSSV